MVFSIRFISHLNWKVQNSSFNFFFGLLFCDLIIFYTLALKWKNFLKCFIGLNFSLLPLGFSLIFDSSTLSLLMRSLFSVSCFSLFASQVPSNPMSSWPLFLYLHPLNRSEYFRKNPFKLLFYGHSILLENIDPCPS